MASLCPAPDERSRKSFLADFQKVSLAEISATLTTWQHMLRRCLDPRNKNFASYGGRGITVCDRWRESFAAFLLDMGTRPDGFSIDRVNNDGNYEPSNCRWATPAEQGRNKRNNRYIEIDGERITQSEAARRAGVSDATIMRRLERGLSVAEALSPKLAPKLKLRLADAEQIRALAGQGLNDEQLAAQFNVSRQMISSIRRGVAWRP